MEHLDRDTLALLAVGEPSEPEGALHLEQCPTCAAEVAALRRVAGRVRAAHAADLNLPAPPERLWDRIEAKIAAAGARAGAAGEGTAAVRAAGGGTAGVGTAGVGTPGAGATGAETAGAGAAGASRDGAGAARASRGSADAGTDPDGGDQAPSEVTTLDFLRNRPEFGRNVRSAWLAAAAALAVIAVVAAGVVVTSQPTVTVVAELELEPLDDRAEAAGARLVEDDGRLLLEVDRGALPDAEGYYEVWLIDDAVEGMVSLGPLHDGEQHAVPDGLDPAGFPIVDVSLEPFDGDPTHSGESLLRGQLDL